MARKIVILSDGTGNSPASMWRTNVWRLYESIDLSEPGQVAYYDDGVGTSRLSLAGILGKAFGFGLKRHVIDIYKFVCRNFRNNDDEIFAFGFSRGGYIIRIVAGLILDQGIFRSSSEEEIERNALAAYRDYRRKFRTRWRLEVIFRYLRDFVISTNYSKDKNFHGATIRFIGLWDTVSAYGARGMSQWIVPLEPPDRRLGWNVLRARHALSIDDDRAIFHPVLWDERDEQPLNPRADGKRHVSDDRISQVWFGGVHANIGGGYPDDSLAYTPLFWIMEGAKETGLIFKRTTGVFLDQYRDGRQYDPRSGLGNYYEYGPRNISELGKKLLSRKGHKAIPKIHESVLLRIKTSGQLYAPSGIPSEYDIVTDQGVILSPTQNQYERPDQARARAYLQERVWNLVWLRRIIYFCAVLVSIYLAVFPLLRVLPRSSEFGYLHWLSRAILYLGSFLPDMFDIWIKGYARDPARFMTIILVLVIVFYLSGLLAKKIKNNMGIIWAKSFASQLSSDKEPTDILYRLRTNSFYLLLHDYLTKIMAPAFQAQMILVIGAIIVSRFLITIADDAGVFCRDVTNPIRLTLGQTLEIPERYRTSRACQNMNVVIEQDAEYRLKIDVKERFRNGNLDVDASGGYRAEDIIAPMERLRSRIAVYYRRNLFRPWFQLVARVGSVGGEEFYLYANSRGGSIFEEKIVAIKGGQLFLYVNDDVLPFPWLSDFFYRDNIGSAEVTITRKR